MRRIPSLRGSTRLVQIIALTVFLSLILSGCITPTRRMESWVGHHQSELIASWGPPDRIMPDGKGGTVLDYSYYKDLGQTGHIDRRGNIRTYRRGYKAIRLFYVNSNGVIYAFKWKGL